jgi:hypothetical protein
MNWIIFTTGSTMLDTGLSLYVFYLGFVLYAGLQEPIRQKQWLVVIPAVPIIIPAGIIDVLFNQSIGRILFWEMKYTTTLSQRLDLHYYEHGWRGDLSRRVSRIVNMILAGHIGERAESL